MNETIFSAPFTVEIPPMTVTKDRIPQGWKTLVKYINDSRPSLDGGPEIKNINQIEWCTPGSSLEEVIEIDGVCYLNVLIQYN